MSLNNDDIKQLIAILQRGLMNEETVQPPKTKKTKKKINKAIDNKDNDDTIPVSDHTAKEQRNTSDSKKSMVNKFYDMPEFRLHKEDTDFDKKVKRFPPTPRNRSFNYVKVSCRVCGKQEQVSPSLVESMERYKCNKCCTMSG